MRKTIYKVVIIIAVTLLILIGIMYLIDWNRMKKGKEVVFCTWGEKYAPVQNIDENEEIKIYNPLGQIIYTGSPQDIPVLEGKGLYIIYIGKSAVKILL